LKAHFQGDENAREIVDDIEARIAEKLTDSGESTISKETVERMISEIGSAEALDDEGDVAVTSPTQARKLYRSLDGRVIAGVCSGIAAYIGIDPIIIRLLFIVSIFAGGTGVVLYLLFWIFVPTAKTPAQKLEMRGSAVTVGTLHKMIKEQSSSESSVVSRILYFPFAAIGSAIGTLGNSLPLLRKVAGIILALGAFFSILGISIGAALAGISITGKYFTSPLFAAVPHATLYGLIIAGFVAALIPLLFILALGMRLLRYRYSFGSSVGFGLIGAWFIAILLSAVLLASSVASYSRYIRTAPAYQKVTQDVPVGAFTEIDVIGNVSVDVTEEGPRSVSLEGRQKDMGRVTATVENGILTVRENKVEDRNCAFCDSATPDVVIHAPDVSSISVENGSLTLEDAAVPSLALTAKHGANINATMDAGTLTVSGDSGYFSLFGTAGTATFNLLHSSVSAEGLTIQDADVTAMENSKAEVYVMNSLHTRNDPGSSIVYEGRAKAVHEFTSDSQE
jgi:phage shock protein PspC (stress-responsive transcriptional regulator)